VGVDDVRLERVDQPQEPKLGASYPGQLARVSAAEWNDVDVDARCPKLISKRTCTGRYHPHCVTKLHQADDLIMKPRTAD
jgi:hypothetical protein